MYDGSMLEWSADETLEIAQKVALERPPDEFWVAVTSHRGRVARIDGRELMPFLERPPSAQA